MRLALCFGVLLASQLGFAVTSDSLLRKYKYNSEFDVVDGEFKPRIEKFADKLGPNYYKINKSVWLKFEESTIQDSRSGVWRLSEIKRNSEYEGTIATTATFYKDELRTVTHCFGSKDRDGFESSRFSCVTASAQVCEFVNNYFSPTEGVRGKSQTARAAVRLTPEATKMIEEINSKLMDGRDPGPSLATYAKYMSEASKAVTFSINDQKEGHFNILLESEHDAIKSLLKATGLKYKSNPLSFSAFNLAGSSLDDLAKRSETLLELSEKIDSMKEPQRSEAIKKARPDLLAAADQIKICKDAAGDFRRADPRSRVQAPSSAPATK